MEGWRVALALGVPWLTGTLGVRALWRNAPVGGWPLALGYGYFLGLLAAILLLRAQVAAGGPLDWTGPTLALAVLGLAGGALARRRGGLSVSCWNPWRAMPGGIERGLFILLLAWLGWRLFLLAQEVWLRPLYPWDAWTTWGVRARVWSELHQWVPFVDPQHWLADASGSVYTVHAWEYPDAVSLLALWPTLAFGAWHEPVAHLPWLGAGVALGLGFYGQARLWGASPLAALIFVWLLLSLPVLDTHIALAGYADLWLAAVFGLAVCALLQWARTGDRWQGVLALLLALACPWIKREGLVWALLLIPAVAVVWTPRRYWLWLAGGFLLALTLWWMTGGVAFTVTGWGEVRLTPEVIQLPALGRFELHYHDIWEPVVRNLLILGNWHLLGYLLLAALLAGLPRTLAEPWRLAGMIVMGSGLLMLFVLFFFTEAYLWAVEYTSINRVFLQFAPALLFWVLTVSVSYNPVVSSRQPPADAPAQNG
ncbi:MAG TPA: hypothetical protein P5102_05970 [Candidatus Competibacteraceae bacterium]|nr:hypothetical protein [Candidatus Competibacteraceae bacterium]HRZ05687.1 hypothetical protein [Candidatus Competibacteraceae bacterium]HSA46252.1 hypothetical protein [Candidatus Competibacteraceae bacterium]